MSRIIDPIGRYARSVGIVRPVPREGFEFRKLVMKDPGQPRSPSGALRYNPLPGSFAFFAIVAILTACTHAPMVSPGETISEDDDDAAVEIRAMDTCDRSIAHAELEAAPIFVQH